MASLQSTSELPTELGLVVQLTTDDNRPTLILATHSSPWSIVYRNPAFDHVLSRSAPHDLDQWLTLESSEPCLTEATNATTFAGRDWTKKKLGKEHVIIYCKHKFVSVAPSSVNGRDSQRLDSLMHDWIRFPEETPANDWTRFLRNYDWGSTAIGALYGPEMQQWPAQLRDIILTFMHCPRPRIIYWGDEMIQFYNASAAKLYGEAHPAALGNKQIDIWGQDMRDQTAELIRGTWEGGLSVRNKERQLLLERNGFLEEGYFDWFLLPFVGTDGRWTCSVNCFNEVTSSVFHKTRDQISQKVISSTASVATLEDVWTEFLGILDQDAQDVSFALLYTVNNIESGKSTFYNFHGSAGLTDDASFHTPPETLVDSFQKTSTGDGLVIMTEDEIPSELRIATSEYGPPSTVMVFPVTDLEGTVLAFVVLAINPRRRADDEMRNFIYSLSEMLLKSVIIFQAPPNQRKLLRADDSLSYRLQMERLSRQLAVTTLKAEKEQESFGRMAENAPIGMFMVTDLGKPIYTNDKYHELLGGTREKYYEDAKTGFAWRDSIHPDDAEFVVNTWAAARQSQAVFTVEFRVRAGTKTSPTRARWLEVVVFPQRDKNNNLETLQGYLTDISARKLTEALTAERLNDAMETKRASENFIDLVSHEIRNPLSSILQLADIVTSSLPDTLAPDVRDTLTDAAQTITICAMHQKTIIDEVLTFSKLDNNLLVLCPERVRPREVIEKALKMFEAELTHADVETSIEQIPTDCNVSEAFCDPGRLLQIIINLVTNGIKFTKGEATRKITLSYGSLLEPPTEEDSAVTMIKPRKGQEENIIFAGERLDGETDDIYLYFSVEDTGCGLTPEERQSLFQRFAQASPKTYKQYGSSGLGLFICRELVELQQGQIGMRSEAGVGTKFAFYIKAKRLGRTSRTGSIASVESAVSVKNVPEEIASPFKTVKVVEVADTVQLAPKTTAKDMHVLVVEDNEINRKVMAQQLRKLGCLVHVAEHGLEALNFLSTTSYMANANGSTPLSVILLDVEMPILDGLSCVRRIRQLELLGEIRGHIPVIAITANARSEQIANAIEAGMDEVVTKPFKIKDLVPRMEMLVDKWSDLG